MWDNMALVRRTQPKKNEEIKATDIKIKDDVEMDYGEKVYSSKDRKPIQVDPPVFKAVSSLTYAKDMPKYKVIEEAVQLLIDNLTDNERRLFDMKQEKNKE